MWVREEVKRKLHKRLYLGKPIMCENTHIGIFLICKVETGKEWRHFRQREEYKKSNKDVSQ